MLAPGCSWKLRGAAGCLRVLLEALGCCWGAAGGVHGCSWVVLGVLGAPGKNLGCSWMLLGCSGVRLGCSLGVPGCSWGLLGCSWVLLGAPGCSWVLLGAPGCSWVLLGAPGCSLVLLGVILHHLSCWKANMRECMAQALGFRVLTVLHSKSSWRWPIPAGAGVIVYSHCLWKTKHVHMVCCGVLSPQS